MVKKNKQSNSKKDSRIFAFLATFLSIVGFLIALLVKKEDKYVMFYAKQSLVLFIGFIIAGIVNGILQLIPVLGFIISSIISLFMTILWIFSWVYALSEKEKELPIIGQYAKNLKF
jgi:uncharacterized membrane protein